ncbi:hypothetical protein LL06_02020 [Hoeflea sp. BAL378]|uniref:MBOAT family O-acyltransferase n=1 Tax=Hoeflea sp. BAL378 TaxID=1547437 RepID=UPI0005148697|nr:MBOAT family O-acyltransferase [Hoeflea sp. BAL378]KGF71013.1 hypothetical protein LL06_02020 [Hoeflea sp. BAL378]
MLFSSVEFILLFLPISALIIAGARRIGKSAFLLSVAGCSLVLYGYHVPSYVLLLLASAVANYALAGWVERSRGIYLFGLVANVLALAYFKYADFLIGTVNAITPAGMELPLLHIVLPLAISFITFEQIAFLTDVRSGKVPRGKFIEYFAFITLFPKLIAGPIIRYTELLPQIWDPAGRALDRLITGLCIFSFGLFNKVVFADGVSPLADRIYAAAAENQVSGPDALLGTAAFATRIYFDFSGYSTMAIGLAWIIGFRLPVNFLSPYRAGSIIEFWRRWHMTLSRFLRDYIYFPLGGSRLGHPRRYFNLFAVMLIGGIWHGAGWVFVVWGALHGAALTVNHAWRQFASPGMKAALASTPAPWLLTMSVVLAGWVLFNSTDLTMAGNIFRSLDNWDIETTFTAREMVFLTLTWAVVLLTPNAARIFNYRFLATETDWNHMPPIPVPSLSLVVVSSLAMVVSLIFVVSGSPNAFIYFQF